MIKKIMFAIMFFVVLGFCSSAFSQSGKLSSKDGQKTIVTQLTEIINTGQIEKIIVVLPVGSMTTWKEFKVLSNNILLLKSGEEVFYVNIDLIKAFNVEAKEIKIWI
jgi:hypothetical protein